MFKNDPVQHPQATPTYTSLHEVYLYTSSLNQPECISNAIAYKSTYVLMPLW